MHPLISEVTGTAWIEGGRDADYGLSAAAGQVRAHRPDVVFVTSPNNPTGTSVPLDLIEEIYDAAAGLVIVDEAYAEFVRAGTPSALTLLPGRPRLVVTRTMSKAFAAAGTRLGYLAADPAVIDALLLVRLPYHLSTVTQAVARAAIANRDEPLATVEALRRDRDDLVAWLRGLGFTVADSDANFVLFGVFDDRDAVWQGLLDRGVLIRNTGPKGWLRVSVGTPAENDAFKRALKEDRKL
jgi:histidinol-phosphate aminotransferase